MLSKSSNWNASIDFLRFASALLVVLSHCHLTPAGFIWSGVHGVSIFFIVSGYCMGYSVQGRSPIAFAAARFTRLLPAFFFAVLLTSAAEALLPFASPDRGQQFGDTLSNLACIPLGNIICDMWNFSKYRAPFSFLYVDGAYWSLLVEFRFYILLGLLYFVLRLNQRMIVVIFSALALGSILQPFSREYLSKSSDFLMYLPFFAFGIAYRLYKSKDASPVFMALPLISFAVLCFVGTVSISMPLNRENMLGFALCFAAFVLVMNIKIKYSDALKVAGAISYPLYLLQQDLGYVISGGFQMEGPLFSIFKVIVMLALSLFVYRWIERPVQNGLNLLRFYISRAPA